MTPELELSPNEDLCRAVREAISRSEPIRAIAMDGLTVRARDGAVVLEGLVPSEAQRYVAEQLARRVPGVHKVENRLITNQQVESLVAMALASAETTRHLRIAVRVIGGIVRLYGAVASAEEADSSVLVASSAARGAEVQSHLQIVPVGTPVILLWQCSVEGRHEAALLKPATESVPEVTEASSEVVSAEPTTPAPIGGTA